MIVVSHHVTYILFWLLCHKFILCVSAYILKGFHLGLWVSISMNHLLWRILMLLFYCSKVWVCTLYILYSNHYVYVTFNMFVCHFEAWKPMITICFHCMAKKQLEHSGKYLLSCSTEQRYTVIECHIMTLFIVGWTIPLILVKTIEDINFSRLYWEDLL